MEPKPIGVTKRALWDVSNISAAVVATHHHVETDSPNLTRAREWAKGFDLVEPALQDNHQGFGWLLCGIVTHGATVDMVELNHAHS